LTLRRAGAGEFLFARAVTAKAQDRGEITVELGVEAVGCVRSRLEHDLVDERAQDLGGLGLDGVVVELGLAPEMAAALNKRGIIDRIGAFGTEPIGSGLSTACGARRRQRRTGCSSCKPLWTLSSGSALPRTGG
jgi:hypothetical protein